MELCKGYEWCFAAEVVLRDIWPTPTCGLITDRPTFENVYGQDQNYKWATKNSIDGVDYQTLCGGGGCTATEGGLNWDGGKLNPREGHFCYKKTSRIFSLLIIFKSQFAYD